MAQAGEVLKLPGGRLLMEAQALFSYGAAAASLRLLWRYRLLDVLAPPLAARFSSRKLPRCATPSAMSLHVLVPQYAIWEASLFTA